MTRIHRAAVVLSLFVLPALPATLPIARAALAPGSRTPARPAVAQVLQRSSVASRDAFTIAPEALARIQSAPKAILVSKSDRTLALLEHGRVVRTYPVAIGKIPEGAKERQGDWRTPEGLYYVARHNGNSRFYKALKVSYPNAQDAERGLHDGLISPAQAAAIRAANERGVLPPQDTRLGHDIEIHGGYKLAVTGPGEPPAIFNVTAGCVAVTDPMIDEIYHWAPDGTPILIQS